MSRTRFGLLIHRRSRTPAFVKCHRLRPCLHSRSLCRRVWCVVLAIAAQVPAAAISVSILLQWLVTRLACFCLHPCLEAIIIKAPKDHTRTIITRLLSYRRHCLPTEQFQVVPLRLLPTSSLLCLARTICPSMLIRPMFLNEEPEKPVSKSVFYLTQLDLILYSLPRTLSLCKVCQVQWQSPSCHLSWAPYCGRSHRESDSQNGNQGHSGN